MRLKIAICIGITVLFLVTIVYQSSYLFDKKLHLIFCDIGQGDAILIRTADGTDILIDGGPDDSVLSCLEAFRPFWDRTLELVFMTHPDSDHAGGLVDITKRFRIGEFVTQPSEHSTDIYTSVVTTLEHTRVPIRHVKLHDEYRFANGLTLRVLWPNDHNTVGETLNANSVILLLTYGSFQALLTGDADAEVVNDLMRQFPRLTVLKLSHHGSYTGTNSDTFAMNRPQLAVITVGRNNRYGHPAGSVLSVLHDRKVPYKRTDRDGTVQIITDGSRTTTVMHPPDVK